MDVLKEKIRAIGSIIEKMQSKKGMIDILKEEIIKLKQLNNEYKAQLCAKKVVHSEKHKNKTRYYLTDGSTYVVGKGYRYLYDANSAIITYEFDNGQVERTFPNGFKEIRYKDGTVVIRNGEKDYECLYKK